MEKTYNIKLRKNEIYTLQNLLAGTRTDFRNNIKDLQNLFNYEVDKIENWEKLNR